MVLLLLVFNWFGYRIVVDMIQSKEDLRLETALNRQLYNEEDLLELKIPVSMPYQTDWSDYERYDGEVEYKGNFYKFVKRKVANDTLYLKCINNSRKAEWASFSNNIFKSNHDLVPASKQSSTPKNATFKKIPDFISNTLKLEDPLSIILSKPVFLENAFVYSHFPIDFIGQPPEQKV